MVDAHSTPRADAKRNRDRLVAVAQEAFVEYGTEASLRDVARRAGVGIGTLYRHFPTREALLEAVLGERFSQLRDLAAEFQGTVAPEEALTIWLRRFVNGSAAFRGLPESMLIALRDEGSELHQSCAAMRAAGTALLTEAQRAGAVRDDVTSAELMALVSGISWAAEYYVDNPGMTDRLLTLVLQGLATGE